MAPESTHEFDLGPLSWVQGEIDQALTRGLESLALFRANPSEGTSLKHARAHVHQAAGAIQMVGLDAVVALVTKDGKTFGADPRGGPWAAVIKADPAFAAAYAAQDIDAYKLIVVGMARTMFDRDTAPGAEPEDLLRLDIPALVIPGRDAAHATSAARYLEECLPRAEYWDVPVAEQTETVAPLRIMEFLGQASAAA